MSYLSGRLFKLIFLVVLLLVVKVLQLLFGGKSKKQKKLESQNKYIMRMPSGIFFGFLALGVMMFAFCTFLVYLALMDGAWEEAGSMMILVEAIVLLWVLAAGWFCYYARAKMIVFDREKVMVYKPFKAIDEMTWTAFSRIEIQDARCLLFDNGGQVRLKVNANWDNFALFCQTAKERIAENENTAV